MLFMIHIGLSLALLSLTAGAALWIWSTHDRENSIHLGRIIGLFVIILSFSSIICGFYFGSQSWKEIYLFKIMQNAQMHSNGEVVPEASSHYVKIID